MALPVRPSTYPSPSPEPSLTLHRQTESHTIQSETIQSPEDEVMSSPLSSVPASPAGSTTSNTSKKRAAPEPVGTNPAKKRAAPNPKPARPAPMPAKGRPRRNAKAPTRFEDEKFEELPKPKSTRGASKVFDPTYITTNSQSRLGKADVYHLLCAESAWTCLNPQQQDTLLAMLPTNPANASLRAEITAGQSGVDRPKELTEGKEIFRTDVAKFKADLAAGHLAKTWLADAQQAVLDRAEGNFDAWKEAESESWWGENA